MRRALAVSLLIALAATSACAGTGIGTVVKMLESRYPVHHHGVPALWLAKPFLIGSGVGGLKIAEFKNFSVPGTDMNSVMEQVGQALGPEWRPFVQTWSQHDGEWSVIYAAATTNKLRMLVLSSEKSGGTTLVQMDVSGNARWRWFDEPVDSARRANRERAQRKKN